MVLHSLYVSLTFLLYCWYSQSVDCLNISTSLIRLDSSAFLLKYLDEGGVGVGGGVMVHFPFPMSRVESVFSIFYFCSYS